jgi:hypothetical protein
LIAIMNVTLKKIVIDHTQVAGALEDFPVLIVATCEPAVRAGEIVFIAADETTVLAHEIVSLDSATGRISAWVRIPHLSDTEETVLFLVCGERESADRGGAVWDVHYRLVTEGGGRCLVTKPLETLPALTVEAWVECDEPVAESMQAVVSQWEPQQSFTAFDAYDAGHTSGLETTGFFGAVFDGRYVYFAPQHDSAERHGKVLRYDTHGGFQDSAAWMGYDAGYTDGLNTKGYYGGVFDGRYVTFIPRRDSEDFHSRFLRYDTRGGFDDPASWAAHAAGVPNSYQSAAFDGRYIYGAPGQRSIPAGEAPEHNEGHVVTGMKSGMVPSCSGLIMRVDTEGNFKDPASYETYDAEQTDGLETRDFDGAILAGPYIYFAPLSYGKPLRYDTRCAFSDSSSWSAFDARPLGLIRSVGAVFDGRYVYYASYGETASAVRYDTKGDFTDASSWSSYEITRTQGRRRLGYDGAIFDGRYIYYVPYWDAGDDYHGEMLRYDTRGAFSDPQSWWAVDAGRTGGLLTVGFNGATFDGRYIYCAPWNDGANHPGLHGHGAVLRYDTVGTGASFSLRYSDCGHNGGLGAALPGPRFLVATRGGVISVAANRPMPPGRHHLAGVYDGRSIKFYIDGRLVNEQEASGEIQAGDGEITIGSLAGGGAAFTGTIGEVRVSATARNADWLATQYVNQQSPGAFAVVQH